MDYGRRLDENINHLLWKYDAYVQGNLNKRAVLRNWYLYTSRQGTAVQFTQASLSELLFGITALRRTGCKQFGLASWIPHSHS